MGRPDARLRRLALVTAMPALLCAAALLVIGVGGFMQPRSPQARVGTFGDAIRHEDVERAYAFVRAGQDPNAPVPFRDAALTADRDIRVAPLLIAVADNNDNAALMLLGAGALMEAPGNRYAVCVARQMGYRGLADLLIREVGRQWDAVCPERPVAPDAPLLAVAEPGS